MNKQESKLERLINWVSQHICHLLFLISCILLLSNSEYIYQKLVTNVTLDQINSVANFTDILIIPLTILIIAILFREPISRKIADLEEFSKTSVRFYKSQTERNKLTSVIYPLSTKKDINYKYRFLNLYLTDISKYALAYISQNSVRLDWFYDNFPLRKPNLADAYEKSLRHTGEIDRNERDSILIALLGERLVEVAEGNLLNITQEGIEYLKELSGSTNPFQ